MMHDYIDSWSVELSCFDGFDWICYGLPNERAAVTKARSIKSLDSVYCVNIIHTSRATPQARWKKEMLTLK